MKRKLLVMTLACAMVLSLSLSAWAQVPLYEPVPIVPRYHSITGIVEQVVPRYDVRQEVIPDSYSIWVRHGEDAIAVFVVDAGTPFLTERQVETGDTFTGWYDATRPMILIYPPQYTTVAAAVNADPILGYSVGVFDENLLRDDELLQLEWADSSQAALPDGTPFEGIPAGEHLAVVYHPAQDASPQRGRVIRTVVVTPQEQPVVPETLKLWVKGAAVEGPAPYYAEDGTVMVPLRAAAEALGYAVGWDEESRSVTVGMGISLTVGRDYYVYMRTAPIELGVAPAIRDERTFVPLSFFNRVMRLDQAVVENGLVILTETLVQPLS